MPWNPDYNPQGRETPIRRVRRVGFASLFMALVTMLGFLIQTQQLNVHNSYSRFLAAMSVCFIVLAACAFQHVWRLARKTFDRLANLGVIDQTSGSFDSIYIKLRLDEEEDRAKRYGGLTSLLCIEVDGIEQTRGRFGPQAADAVLESLVDVMSVTLRQCDVFGRLEENEFIAILPETDRRNARNVAERLRSAGETFSFDCPDGGKVDFIRLNIGAAALPINGETMACVLAAARDAAGRIRSSDAPEVGVSDKFVRSDELGEYIIEEVRGEKKEGA
jgi:diguanylate cyclase (GGDEF)-like protein